MSIGHFATVIYRRRLRSAAQDLLGCLPSLRL